MVGVLKDYEYEFACRVSAESEMVHPDVVAFIEKNLKILSRLRYSPYGAEGSGYHLVADEKTGRLREMQAPRKPEVKFFSTFSSQDVKQQAANERAQLKSWEASRIASMLEGDKWRRHPTTWRLTYIQNDKNLAEEQDVSPEKTVLDFSESPVMPLLQTQRDEDAQMPDVDAEVSQQSQQSDEVDDGKVKSQQSNSQGSDDSWLGLGSGFGVKTQSMSKRRRWYE